MIDYKYIRKPSFVGLLFWYRGDFANTMELGETTAREYVGIKDQREGKEEQLQFDFWGEKRTRNSSAGVAGPTLPRTPYGRRI